MENKETQLISLVLNLEEIIIDVEGFKGMFLALEEALFHSGNWDKENYRYMVHHMFRFISEINRDLKDSFNELKEKASNTKSDSDQANQR
jgi:hypothetical protein